LTRYAARPDVVEDRGAGVVRNGDVLIDAALCGLPILRAGGKRQGGQGGNAQKQ